LVLPFERLSITECRGTLQYLKTSSMRLMKSFGTFYLRANVFCFEEEQRFNLINLLFPLQSRSFHLLFFFCVRNSDLLVHRVSLVEPVPSSTKLKVNRDGLAILRTIEGPVAPVVVIGPYRSGKSFLINQMLQQSCGALPGTQNLTAISCVSAN
jgi:hypothetical protein